MANLQVKNIPDDLHGRLRAYAREHNSTISAVVLAAVSGSWPAGSGGNVWLNAPRPTWGSKPQRCSGKNARCGTRRRIDPTGCRCSVAVEYLLRTPLGITVANTLDRAFLVAPELMDAEVLSVPTGFA